MGTAEQASGSGRQASDRQDDSPQERHSDFQPTQSDSLEPGAPEWWPESADGQCSQSAALFAASQPAPLSIV